MNSNVESPVDAVVRTKADLLQAMNDHAIKPSSATRNHLNDCKECYERACKTKRELEEKLIAVLIKNDHTSLRP